MALEWKHKEKWMHVIFHKRRQLEQVQAGTLMCQQKRAELHGFIVAQN